MKRLITVILATAFHVAAVVAGDFRESGAEHLAEITRQPWAATWRNAELKNIRLVAQKADLAHPTGLPPAWHAEIRKADEKTGYLLWDADAEGKLIEFALDEKLTIDSAEAKALEGVPALQQFPIPGPDGKPTASGCVPTAGASLMGFWIANGHPGWGNNGKDMPEDLTRRLRSQLKVEHWPDTDGFTGNGMPLTGAMPDALARAIEADAKEHEVPMTTGIYPFWFRTLRTEINSGRPVLLSCTVRLPHKPELSWNHEVVGTGWARIADTDLVGILDNFYPTRNAQTVRWIRKDAFHSLIMVKVPAAPANGVSSP